MIVNSDTRLFIGRTALMCVAVESVEWTDKRSTYIILECPYSSKHLSDMITPGITIDLMTACDMDMTNRDGYMHVMSFVNIYGVYRTIPHPVINDPTDAGRLTIKIHFYCSLEFADASAEGGLP